MLTLPADAAQREQALDVYHSYIVQAPAGSGKTELLIQRILALLVTVDSPEEIIAITFTRKAAAEMRARVLAALYSAEQEQAPKAAHQLQTWKLARAVRLHAAKKSWNIDQNPNRLRIQTIDALCQSLARQMPVMSRLGGQPKITTIPQILYAEAARRTLALLDEEIIYKTTIATLLLHLDNNQIKVANLFIEMLSKRDQWLDHLCGHGADTAKTRAILEASLVIEIEAGLTQALRFIHQLPIEDLQSLIQLTRHAASQLESMGIDTPLRACLDWDGCIRDQVVDLALWHGIMHFMFTKDDEVRKSLNKNNGFPPKDPRKPEAIALLGRLATVDRQCLKALLTVRSLPLPTYTEKQWQVLGALLQILPVLAAQLNIVMGERHEADFQAIALAALEALGADDNPTDLALSLDYRIHHLLIDEFQDTAAGQRRLIERLVQGWEEGDGRTLFVVGDPMQSIYRFRQADVGLYLSVRQDGIAGIPLRPLMLSVNFRSQPGIVKWVNHTFEKVLPKQDDLLNGAVTYSASTCARQDTIGGLVKLHSMTTMDREQEADLVFKLIRESLASDVSTIAVLVRNRSHLVSLIPLLKKQNISFQAIDIEALGERPVVQDLFALTRALLHSADSIAWLAVLRAPWCGISLADLTHLLADDQQRVIWEAINDELRFQQLSMDGQVRILKLRNTLATFITQRRRVSLSRWVEGAWLALGGPACLELAVDLADAHVFFNLLEAHQTAGDLLDFEVLTEQVQQLFALPDTQCSARLQLMTIHKAKGLEFDVVIVPSLGRAPRSNKNQLLQWNERRRPGSSPYLLLAPLSNSNSHSNDSLYSYMNGLESLKSQHEDARLLYVAATRARSVLHLIGQIKNKQKSLDPNNNNNAQASTSSDQTAQEIIPNSRSLLARLWPAISSQYISLSQNTNSEEVHNSHSSDTISLEALRYYRLPIDWSRPQLPLAIHQNSNPVEPELLGTRLGEVEFNWASASAMHVGTVVHRGLQSIADQGLEQWPLVRIVELRPRWQRELTRLGVPESELNTSIERVIKALQETLNDKRGRWLLAAHPDAQAELKLTGLNGTQLLNIVIDRTFIDAAGVRWVIDYKTSAHTGSGIEQFLNNEQERYRPQLERYAEFLSALGHKNICMGLYFPLLGGWREWNYQV